MKEKGASAVKGYYVLIFAQSSLYLLKVTEDRPIQELY